MLYRYAVKSKFGYKGLLTVVEDFNIQNDYTLQAQVLTLGELPLPRFVDMGNTISFFKEEGYKKFKDDMELTVYGFLQEYTYLDGSVPVFITVDESDVPTNVIYEDEYQIIFENYIMDTSTHNIKTHIVKYEDIQALVKTEEEIQLIYAHRLLGDGKAMTLAKGISNVFYRFGVTKKDWGACHSILQLFTAEFKDRHDLKLNDKLEEVRSAVSDYLVEQNYIESLDMLIPYIWYVHNKKHLVAVTPKLEQSAEKVKSEVIFERCGENVLLSFLYKITMDYGSAPNGRDEFFNAITRCMNGAKDVTDLLVPFIKKSQYV